MMGLIANIYKWSLPDCSNGGISGYADEVTFVNIAGPFEPTGDRPAVLLRDGNVPGTLKVVPAEQVRRCVNCNMRADEVGDGEPICKVDGLVSGHSFVDRWEEIRNGVGPMMGGAYVATSDSRFREACETMLGHRFYGALPLHDRYETQAQYDANFD